MYLQLEALILRRRVKLMRLRKTPNSTFPGKIKLAGFRKPLFLEKQNELKNIHSHLPLLSVGLVFTLCPGFPGCFELGSFCIFCLTFRGGHLVILVIIVFFKNYLSNNHPIFLQISFAHLL
jgi:hypothetical protein